MLIFKVRDNSAPNIDFRCMLGFVRAVVHLSLLGMPCIFLNVLDPTKLSNYIIYKLFLLGDYQQ